VDERFIVPPPLYYANNPQILRHVISLLRDESKRTVRRRILLPKEKIRKHFLYGNPADRNKRGKLNYARQNTLRKLFLGTGRAVIVPDPSLRANETILPESMGEQLGWPPYVLLGRFPTLDLQNITFHRVVRYWPEHAIAVPITVTKRHHADFDGDEMQVSAILSSESVGECRCLLDPCQNFVSMQKIKLNFGPDSAAACRRLTDDNLNLLERDLYETYVVSGSEATFGRFNDIYDATTDLIWEKVGCGLSVAHLSIMARDYPEDYLEFKARLMRDDWGFTWFAGKDSEAAFEVGHLYQMTKQLGPQRLTHCKSRYRQNPTIRGNFLSGLSREEFLVHSQAARDALIDSNFGISKGGYCAYKLAFCGKDLVVHYDGSVHVVSGEGSRCVASNFRHLFPNDDLSDGTYEKICDVLDERFVAG
jgi:hypothetical protein